MIINKVEIEDLDFYDADTIEKLENVLAEVSEKHKEIQTDCKTSESIRKQCNLVFDCFNKLFGEGTDIKIFGGKTNLLICLKAFEELISQVNSQKGELDKMFNKYSSNRIQRRSK